MSYAQEIRQAVLLAAVSGQLTTTFESDTPIEEYIQQLKVEKGVVGGERKARKGQNIDAITDEEIPCDIPTTWRYIRIIDVAKSISAGGDKPSNFSKEKTKQYSVPVISNGETNMGIFGYTDIPSVSELALTVSARGTIGYSVIRNEPFVPIVRLLVILPLKGTNLQYIQLTLSALIEFGSGTAVKQLTVPMISPKVIPLPPPEEQQRIVDRVNELLAKIDEFEKIENRLTAVKEKFPSDLRAAILQAAMQGKLTEQLDTDEPIEHLIERCKVDKGTMIQSGKCKADKFTGELDMEISPYTIPDTWRVVHISDATLFQEGPGILAVDFRPKGVPLIRLSGMQTNSVTLSGCNYLDENMVKERWNHFRLDKGDVIISTSASMDKIAEVINTDVVGAIPYTGLIRFKMYGGINKEYFKYFIKSPWYLQQINVQKKGDTIKHYGPSHLKKMIIPLPPIEEQQRIVERLDALLPLCDELTEE